LISLIAISTDRHLRQEFSLDQNSRVLLIGSEGATDPELYHDIMVLE